MHLEIAREAVHVEKSTPSETLRETAQAGKSASVEKNEENKKRKLGNH